MKAGRHSTFEFPVAPPYQPIPFDDLFWLAFLSPLPGRNPLKGQRGRFSDLQEKNGEWIMKRDRRTHEVAVRMRKLRARA